MIRGGEGRRVVLLFAQLLTASAIFILGRTVRDTLFLSRYSLSALPWMFVAYGGVSACVAIVYARFADRLPRHRMLLGTAAIGATTYLGTWGCVRAEVIWIYPLFYVWSEVVANLFLVQFWTLANELFDARAAKRLFGVVGSARVLGVILIGTSTGAVVKVLGTPQLLFVLIALMGVMSACALALRHEPRGGVTPAAPSRAAAAPPSVTKSPYARILALVILLTFTTLTVGDYQFKAIARETYTGDDLARFFSLFYATVGVVSFVFQIVVTPRLLRRFGVGVGLATMPSVFGAASAALLVMPALPIATVMKFADNGFQYTIHETTLQALYVPFAAKVKARVRALLEAVVKPCSYGAGGLVLALAAPSLTLAQLSAITTPLVVAWLALVPIARRRYQRALEATLSARGELALDADVVLDASGREALLRVLEQGEPRHALAALEQLEGDASPRVAPALARLVREGGAPVRAAALGYLARRPEAPGEIARDCLGDDDPEVRAAAVEAYARTAKDEAVERLVPLLDDPDLEVRAQALAGLLRDGGVEGTIESGARLAHLLSSPGREERIEAARVLGELGRGAFRPIARLLHDPDPVVRRAALRACRGVADPRLAEALTQLLADPACRVRARESLAAIGPTVLPRLIALLDAEETSRDARLELPRVIRQLHTIDAYVALRERVGHPDDHLRLRIISALAHLRAALASPPEPSAWVEDRVRHEVQYGLGVLAGWERVRPRCETPLLVEAMALHEARVVRRVLRLLELRYDPQPLRLVRAHVSDPRRRANALETLDATLGAGMRRLVMAVFDDVPISEKLASIGASPPSDDDAFLRAHATSPSPFIAFVTLHALGERGDRLAAELGAAAATHRDPLVREGAVLALSTASGDRAGDPSDDPVIARLLRDPDVVVRRLARARFTKDLPTEEAKMRSTVEKIVILKSTPVFEKIPAADLAPLARVATEESFPPDSRIFAAGEHGDSLYVVVRGRVRIGHASEELASLGPGEAFGEMAVLDASPRSADATAVEETEVLRIGSEEFYEILHEQVELAEGVIRMLARRLRTANASTGGDQGRRSIASA
jgi:ATP/ADP translocase/HEAT repeat protein